MGMGHAPGSRGKGRSFLKRLRDNQSGNILPVMAMALVPMAGMIGSGLDMSRAYMTKAKLQTACDSAALATRRAMGGEAFSDEHEAEGEKFFAFNFPEGTMGTEPVELEIGVDTENTDVVEITATTTVPTSMMKLFGKDEIPVEVACNADQDFVHNDIMLVLDVTGSMNCRIGSGRSGCPNEESNARIAALRGAAIKLYEALEDADPGVVTRYGFMPYSVATNVARDLSLDWVRQSNITYHTYSNNRYNTASNYSKTNAWLTGTWRQTYSSTASPSTSLPGYWGCVEERSSYSQKAAANITITSAVSQEDIDHLPLPSEPTLKWVPYDPQITSWRSGGGEACPAPASRLAAVADDAAFQARLNAAIRYRGGATHHDVGMIWGMRYLSSTGMFSDDNPEERDEMRVDKHIVFLSDGQMQVNRDWYSAIGIPGARVRTTGSGSDASKASARFISACNRAREMDMTVWVIALDEGAADENLPDCASGDDHFFVAETPEELESAFDRIGKEIGKLRLTK